MKNDFYSRKDCCLRNDVGNCGCIGGFCTAVNDEICRGLKNAYYCGIARGVQMVKDYKDKCDGLKHYDDGSAET